MKGTSMLSSAALCGVSALAMIASAPALAQSSTGSAPASQAVPLTDQGAGQEIVVTAQKRAERLESIPISITSVGGDTLAKSSVGVASQLPQLVPSLRIDYSGAFAQPTIRGVGSAASGTGLSANVATYIDGFYVPSTLSNDFQLLSVTNVSVLKGPQGTLFGRNATGGAILVTTRDPSFKTTAQFTGSYARFNHGTVSGYFSTGLTDRIAFDVAGIYEHGDGFLHNILTGNKKAGEFEKYNIRSKLLFQLDDTTKFTLTYQHNHASDPNPQEGDLYDNLGVGTFVPGSVFTDKRGEVAEDFQSSFHLNVNAVYLKAEKDLGFATLTSYTQYRAQKTDQGADYDRTSIPIFNYRFFYKENSISQELNLTSKDTGRLKWVAGVYYFHDNDRQTNFLISVGGAPFVQGYTTQQKTDAIAGFVDATYEPFDHLFLTGGLRYSSEHRSANYLTQSLLVGALGGDSNSKTWNSATPRAVIRYELSPRTNVYASFSQGFKSGAFNPSGQNVSDPVNPEKIDAYEVGFKTASHLLRFNASAYYYNYRNLQISAYTSTQGILRNAASSHIYGGDVDLVVTPTSNLTFKFAGAYTHATFTKFLNAPYYAQCLNPTTCGAAFGTFIPVGIDASGDTLPRSPRWTGNMGIQYVIPIGGANLTLNADYYRTSRVYFDPVEQFSQKGYGIMNLRATLDLPDRRTSIALFGTNVTDSVYRNQVLPAALSIGETYGEPVSYGMSVSYKF